MIDYMYLPKTRRGTGRKPRYITHTVLTMCVNVAVRSPFLPRVPISLEIFKIYIKRIARKKKKRRPELIVVKEGSFFFQYLLLFLPLTTKRNKDV